MSDWSSWRRRRRLTIRAIKTSDVRDSRVITAYVIDVVIARDNKLDE